jgi:hypothetical protein
MAAYATREARGQACHRIFLNSSSASEWAQLFRSAMEAAGWSEGDNITVDYRIGARDRAKIDAAANDLIATAPDLIYAIGLPAAQSVQARTRTIPIVFTRVADPIYIIPRRDPTRCPSSSRQSPPPDRTSR